MTICIKKYDLWQIWFVCLIIDIDIDIGLIELSEERSLIYWMNLSLIKVIETVILWLFRLNLSLSKWKKQWGRSKNLPRNILKLLDKRKDKEKFEKSPQLCTFKNKSQKVETVSGTILRWMVFLILNQSQTWKIIMKEMIKTANNFQLKSTEL